MAKAGKAAVRPPSRVWRISENAPLGEWVDPGLDRVRSPAPPPWEAGQGAFVRSSFDLLDGVEVCEEAGVSDEVFAELFGDSAPGALGAH